MEIRIADIAASLEKWAPPATAESWDVVGLHVGEPTRKVERALIALDMTPQVFDEAKKLGVQLVITHHPLLLKPVSRFTPASPTGHLALQMAEAGIALYCIHTNIDRARDGVSFALAKQLGLENIQFLGGLDGQLVKLVAFVPETHAESVRDALTEAGAGQIGNYSSCSFSTPGTGTFRPLDGSNPTIGTSGGEMELVNEVRLEVLVPRWNQSSVLKALASAHPYEEIAYDIYPVEQPYSDAGYGAIGNLSDSETLESFLRRVCQNLDNPAVRYTGDLQSHIRTVAVCGGAGTPFIHLAKQKNADAFVTSDVSHHRFFEVLDLDGNPTMALIDAGHYETERFTENILHDHLARTFPAIDWNITSIRTGAAETYVLP